MYKIPQYLRISRGNKNVYECCKRIIIIIFLLQLRNFLEYFSLYFLLTTYTDVHPVRVSRYRLARVSSSFSLAAA